MAAGFDIESIATAKMLHGGTVKSAGAMWLNGQQVWPKVSYVITSARVVYSESAAYPGQSLSYIAAAGDNYATIVGTVEKRRGTRVKETYTNVTLIPVNSAASSVFYITHTSQIHAYDLQCSIRQMTSVTFGVKYISGDGIESALYDVTVSQQGNQITSTVDTITAIGVGIDVTGANFGVTGGTGTLSATKVYSRTYTYTSTHSHTDTDLTSDISDSTTYVLTGGTGAAVSGRTVSVSSRVHNTTAGTWTVTGNYNENGTSYADALGVSQTADVKISETTAASDYSISIGVGTSTISAAGGSATLNWGGTYTLTITQYWQSAPDTPCVITQENVSISGEHISITGSADYFSRSGAAVTHENMVRRTTDSVTYTASVVIGGDTLAYDTVTITATNSRRLTGSTKETTGFAISANPSSFNAGGGIATLSALNTYRLRYDYLWESGAEDTEYSTESSESVSAAYTMAPSSEYSLSGNELTVNARSSAQSASWTVIGIWNGLSATTSVSQEGVIVKEDIYIDARITRLGRIENLYVVYAIASSAVHSDITVNVAVGTETFVFTIYSGNTTSAQERVTLSEILLATVSSVTPSTDTYADYHIRATQEVI